MKDNFKQRVDNTRQEWDLYDTNLEELWDDIESRLEENKDTSPYSRQWLKIAASIAILFIIGWGTISSIGDNNQHELYALRDISPELAETEQFYASKIDEQLQMIRTSSAGVDNLILEDLNLLDSAYLELQEDLKDNADSEEVINAMIQNYRIKLQILEKVMEKIRTKELQDKPNEIII